MHECPNCGQACDCIGDDTWDSSEAEFCEHDCDDIDLGWQYLWVYYENAVDAAAPALIPTPSAAYVEQLAEPAETSGHKCDRSTPNNATLERR